MTDRTLLLPTGEASAPVNLSDLKPWHLMTSRLDPTAPRLGIDTVWSYKIWAPDEDTARALWERHLDYFDAHATVRTFGADAT